MKRLMGAGAAAALLMVIVLQGSRGAAPTPAIAQLRALMSRYDATVQLARVGPFGTPARPAATIPVVVAVRNTGVPMPHLVVSIDTAKTWVPRTARATIPGRPAVVFAPRWVRMGPAIYAWDLGPFPAGRRATLTLRVVPAGPASGCVFTAM